ncbi:MAG: hypothetical protein ACRD6X_18550 [Pyrinomonadaceae bacterium]
MWTSGGQHRLEQSLVPLTNAFETREACEKTGTQASLPANAKVRAASKGDTRISGPQARM